MRTRDGLGMDWTRSGWTTGGLQQDSMSIGGLHVDSHRIPGGVKYTADSAEMTEQNEQAFHSNGDTHCQPLDM
jgi:hypothetical protein